MNDRPSKAPSWIQSKQIVILSLLILGSSFVVPHLSYADSKSERFNLEMAPEEDMKCSWSKLSSADYKDCQERKKFFGKMSESEREQHNEDVEKRWNGQKVKSKSGRKSDGEKGNLDKGTESSSSSAENSSSSSASGGFSSSESAVSSGSSESKEQ